MNFEIFDPLNWDCLTIVKGAFGAGLGTAGVQVGWSLVHL
jgi:hypothetical protein